MNGDPNVKKQVLTLIIMLGGLLLALNSLYLLVSGFTTYFFDDMGYLFDSLRYFIGAGILLIVSVIISPELLKKS